MPRARNGSSPNGGADWPGRTIAHRSAAPLETGETARDYYKLEDREGRRFWLFRETAETVETALGPVARWYLHGVFA